MIKFKNPQRQAKDLKDLALYKRIDPEAYFHGLQLINKIEGADKYKIVNQCDRHLSTIRDMELRESPIVGKFDLAHLQAVHEYLFQDIYYFAGKLRDVPMEIDPITRFVSPSKLPSTLDKFFRQLKQSNYMKGLGKDAFITQMAQRLTDINIIHPFREGNGRSKRVFFSQLAENAGYKLDWSKCAKEEWKYADEAAFDSSRDGKRDISYLKYLLDQAVSPLERQKSKNTNIQKDNKAIIKKDDMEM